MTRRKSAWAASFQQMEKFHTCQYLSLPQTWIIWEKKYAFQYIISITLTKLCKILSNTLLWEDKEASPSSNREANLYFIQQSAYSISGLQEITIHLRQESKNIEQIIELTTFQSSPRSPNSWGSKSNLNRTKTYARKKLNHNHQFQFT